MTVESMENGGTNEVRDRKEEEEEYGPSRKLDWKETISRDISLNEVDLDTGRDGWAAPPADLFNIRGPNFFGKRVKTPSSEDYILKPLGVDWLKSTAKLEHVLSHPDNVVRRAIEDAHAHGEGLKAFVLAINLMIPGKDHHSAVFYFVTEEPIRQGSLLYRFIHEDDAFRNSRLKMINKIVRGPWIVKAACGNHAACLLGKALTCNYVRGPYYLEIDVDMGSSVIANGLLHLALGYVTSVAVDLAFLVECQTEEELPERLLGAVRVAHMELGGAFAVEPVPHGELEKCSHITGNGLQSQRSWRRLGRSLSLLGGKPGTPRTRHVCMLLPSKSSARYRLSFRSPPTWENSPTMHRELLGASAVIQMIITEGRKADPGLFMIDVLQPSSRTCTEGLGELLRPCEI